MLKEQTNFLMIFLLIFAFIFMTYLIQPYLKKKLPVISGIIVKGTGQTSMYGHPTANMEITKKLTPGIYHGKCKYGKVTVYSEDNFCVKCHIHNFFKDITGEFLKVKHLKFIEPFNHS